MTRKEAKREILFAKREVMADSWIDKAYDVAIKALEEPEIVRCKDCKYQDKGENDCESWNLCGYRPWLYVPVTDDHYCGWARAKRR